MHAVTSQYRSESGSTKEPAHISLSPIVWNRTWSPRGCGSPAALAKRSPPKSSCHGTDVVSTAAPPRNPIEIARNQVHVFAKHHGSNREDELIPNTTFFVART